MDRIGIEQAYKLWAKITLWRRLSLPRPGLHYVGVGLPDTDLAAVFTAHSIGFVTLWMLANPFFGFVGYVPVCAPMLSMPPQTGSVCAPWGYETPISPVSRAGLASNYPA